MLDWPIQLAAVPSGDPSAAYEALKYDAYSN